MPGKTKPAREFNRVFRGGSWDNVASNCRDANRYWNSTGLRCDFLGFRPGIRVSKQNVEQH